MTANTLFEVPDSKIHAIGAVEDFFRWNGGTLSGVLLFAGGDHAFDLFCNTRTLLEGVNPNPDEVQSALELMKLTLEEGRDPGIRLADSLRWHGARISELLFRLR